MEVVEGSGFPKRVTNQGLISKLYLLLLNRDNADQRRKLAPDASGTVGPCLCTSPQHCLVSASRLLNSEPTAELETEWGNTAHS